MRSSTLFALAASLSAASAVFQGFNYGSTKSDGSFMYQADYEAKFANAKNLVGTSGFTSARLYTMIQGGSYTNEPTEAIPAAISQGVSLLLGLWASGGEPAFEAEITALKSAIAQYGTAFTSLVAGISVGSEDLYRISPTGVAALSGYGANPEDIVKYIGLVRTAIQGTPLSGAGVGHVDTWTAWVNSSNSAVAEASDWVGMDAYPYFQNTMANSISVGKQLFNDALTATQAAAGGKPVWITETGWPVSGKTEGQGVASTANAKTYWDEVGCPLFGNVNTWWFTQQDSDPVTPNPSFGIVGSTLSTTPLFDLSCDSVSSSSSSSSSAHSTTASPSKTATGASSATASATSIASAASSVASSAASSFATSIASSIASSIIASISSAAATAPLVSGGGGLSPSQGVPSVVNPSAVPTGTATPSGSGTGSGSGSGSGSGGNGTVPVSPTLSASTTGGGSSTTSPPAIAGNAASAISAGSMIGVIGAVFAAIMAL